MKNLIRGEDGVGPGVRGAQPAYLLLCPEGELRVLLVITANVSLKWRPEWMCSSHWQLSEVFAWNSQGKTAGDVTRSAVYFLWSADCWKRFWPIFGLGWISSTFNKGVLVAQWLLDKETHSVVSPCGPWWERKVIFVVSEFSSVYLPGDQEVAVTTERKLF